MAKTTARVIENGLVINFETTNPKIIWRCSLDKLDNARFFIREKNKKPNLLLSVEKKEENIAVFENSEDAEQAMRAVTKALLSGSKAKAKKSWLKRIIYTLIILLVLYFAFFRILPSIIISNVTSSGASKVTKNKVVKKSSTTSTDKKLKTGVPVSADELFGN